MYWSTVLSSCKQVGPNCLSSSVWATKIKPISPRLSFSTCLYRNIFPSKIFHPPPPPTRRVWYMRVVIMGNKLLKVAEIASSQTGWIVINLSETWRLQVISWGLSEADTVGFIYVWLHPESIWPEPAWLTLTEAALWRSAWTCDLLPSDWSVQKNLTSRLYM